MRSASVNEAGRSSTRSWHSCENASTSSFASRRTTLKRPFRTGSRRRQFSAHCRRFNPVIDQSPSIEAVAGRMMPGPPKRTKARELKDQENTDQNMRNHTHNVFLLLKAQEQ